MQLKQRQVFSSSDRHWSLGKQRICLLSRGLFTIHVSIGLQTACTSITSQSVQFAQLHEVQKRHIASMNWKTCHSTLLWLTTISCHIQSSYGRVEIVFGRRVWRFHKPTDQHHFEITLSDGGCPKLNSFYIHKPSEIMGAHCEWKISFYFQIVLGFRYPSIIHHFNSHV